MREIVFYEIVFLIGLFTSCRKRLFQSPKFYSLVSFMIFFPSRKGLTSFLQVLFIWFTDEIYHYRKGLLRSPKLYSLVKFLPPRKALASLAYSTFTRFARKFFPTNARDRFDRQDPFTRFAREIFIHRVNLSPLTHGYSYIDPKTTFVTVEQFLIDFRVKMKNFKTWFLRPTSIWDPYGSWTISLHFLRKCIGT